MPGWKLEISMPNNVTAGSYSVVAVHVSAAEHEPRNPIAIIQLGLGDGGGCGIGAGGVVVLVNVAGIHAGWLIGDGLRDAGDRIYGGADAGRILLQPHRVNVALGDLDGGHREPVLGALRGDGGDDIPRRPQ